MSGQLWSSSLIFSSFWVVSVVPRTDNHSSTCILTWHVAFFCRKVMVCILAGLHVCCQRMCEMYCCLCWHDCMFGGVSLTVAIRERVKHVRWQVSVKEQVWKQGSTQELVSYPDLQAPPPFPLRKSVSGNNATFCSTLWHFRPEC